MINLHVRKSDKLTMQSLHKKQKHFSDVIILHFWCQSQFDMTKNIDICADVELYQLDIFLKNLQ